MVKSKTRKGNENRGESLIEFKERKFGEGDNHQKKFRFATKHKERILLLQENSDEHIEIYKGIFRIIESLRNN